MTTISSVRTVDVPLCVDLDGTLIAADTLHASLYALLRSRPWACAALPWQVLRGRAAFKRCVAGLISLEPERLPYRQEVLSFLREERQAGRRLLLVTAADEFVARPVAAHLGLFEDVIASDGVANLKGSEKVRAIRAFLGDAEFDYAGDSMVDLPVFAAARHAILVHPSPRLRRLAEQSCRVERVFAAGEPRSRAADPLPIR